MPVAIRRNKCWLLAVAATSVVGLLTTVPPAQVRAYPPPPLAPAACDQWKFNGTLVIHHESGGPPMSIPWDGMRGGTGGVRWSGAPGAPDGFVNGGISGSHLDFTVVFPENSDFSSATIHYTGDIDPEFGSARGTYSTQDPIAGGASGQWVAQEHFTCAAAPAAPPSIQERPPDVIADAPPAQAPPAEQPKQGPTVSWDPVIGGLVAHITDRSGVTSQCTYTSDFFTRSFGLTANSTFDLRIVPAIPQFRNWDVTIACDNGTSTQTTTFF
jgi:hypothetical protein